MRIFNLKTVLAAVFVLICTITILLSPLFYVSEVSVTGNNKLSTDEILNLAGLEYSPVNIFTFSNRKFKKALESNSYVEHVSTHIDYFTKEITIDVEERILSGYVEYMNGTYLYIDENGRVLEVNTSFTEKLPVVVGLAFTEFTVGDTLNVKNVNSFDTVVTLARIFNKYGLESDVIKVDVSNPLNTRLFVKNLDVEIGRIQDADEKIRTMKAIIETLEDGMIDDGVKGFLDLRDINKPGRFRSLT